MRCWPHTDGLGFSVWGFGGSLACVAGLTQAVVVIVGRPEGREAGRPLKPTPELYPYDSVFGWQALNSAKMAYRKYGKSKSMKKGGAVGKELYVKNSSWFVSHPYDVEKITKALESIGATNIHTENESGWSNQPQVVVFNSTEDYHKIQEVVGQALDTEWIIVREKKMDWDKKAKGGKVEKHGIFVFGQLHDTFSDVLTADASAHALRQIHPEWKIEVKKI